MNEAGEATMQLARKRLWRAHPRPGHRFGRRDARGTGGSVEQRRAAE